MANMNSEPRIHTDRVWSGPAGTATELVIDDAGSIDQTATIAAWFLHCPGQSAAWDDYLISIVHLRPIDGQSKPPTIRIPHATHELLIIALDPENHPTATDMSTWRHLVPINLSEQFEVPSDNDALLLLDAALRAVLAGALWVEPPLSGQVEPWRSTMIRTSAHMRGEAHAQ